MTTPPAQGITPPQLDAMITPRIQEVITLLNESTRQEMEVIMRGIATPQMEEVVMAVMTSQRMDEVVTRAMSLQQKEEMVMTMPPQQKEDLAKRIMREMATPQMEGLVMAVMSPQRMEELQIAMATEVETPLETLDSLKSILNKCRLVSSNALCPVAWVLSRMTLPIIPESVCYIFAGLYVLNTIDRIFGIYASYKRKDPKENFIWSICSALTFLPVCGGAIWYYGHKQWPSGIEWLFLLQFTIGTGMAPNTAYFCNIRRFWLKCGLK